MEDESIEINFPKVVLLKTLYKESSGGIFKSKDKIEPSLNSFVLLLNIFVNTKMVSLVCKTVCPKETFKKKKTVQIKVIAHRAKQSTKGDAVEVKSRVILLSSESGCKQYLLAPKTMNSLKIN